MLRDKGGLIRTAVRPDARRQQVVNQLGVVPRDGSPGGVGCEHLGGSRIDLVQD